MKIATKKFLTFLVVAIFACIVVGAFLIAPVQQLSAHATVADDEVVYERYIGNVSKLDIEPGI